MVRKISLLLLVALLISLAAAGALSAQSNRSFFGWVIADRATVQAGGLIVTGDTTLATTEVVGTQTVSGQVLATGDVRTGTDMQVAQVMRVVPNAAISVTNGAAFTPTGTYQPLTSAGTVTPTITATDADAGDILILVNESATTINLADTGTTMLSAAVALGQYDTLVLISDGTNWLEVSRTNN